MAFEEENVEWQKALNQEATYALAQTRSKMIDYVQNNHPQSTIVVPQGSEKGFDIKKDNGEVLISFRVDPDEQSYLIKKQGEVLSQGQLSMDIAVSKLIINDIKRYVEGDQSIGFAQQLDGDGVTYNHIYAEAEYCEVNSKTEQGFPSTVKITTESGTLIRQADEPAAKLNTDNKTLTISTGALAHLYQNHITQQQNGSQFNVENPKDIFRLLNDNCDNIKTEDGKTQFTVQADKKIGTSTVASLNYMLEDGIINTEVYSDLKDKEEEITNLNIDGKRKQKEKFVHDFNNKHPNSNLKLTTIKRADHCIVPEVNSSPKETSKATFVFGTIPGQTGESEQTLFTAYPGQKMPPHPNTKDDDFKTKNGELDTQKFIQAQTKWLKNATINIDQEEKSKNSAHIITNTTPIADGFTMPAEYKEHERTYMIWPDRNKLWRNEAKQAQRAYVDVAQAIVQDEPVSMLVKPGNVEQATQALPDAVNIEPVPVNDAWARDTAPMFVQKEEEIRAVDWGFNAYGGLYDDYEDDRNLSKLVSQNNEIDVYESNMILEGGSVTINENGVVLTTEECLLSDDRNPNLTKQEIEGKLKEYMGARKVIWLPNGIVNDETSGHVDNLATFADNNVVLLHWTDDQSDPQHKRSKEALTVLQKAKTSSGEAFNVIKLPQPGPLYANKNEAEAPEGPEAGERLAASYVNFTLTNESVIAPSFNVKQDEVAHAKLNRAFPDRSIKTVPAREIVLGGGGIHCITREKPATKSDEQ